MMVSGLLVPLGEAVTSLSLFVWKADLVPVGYPGIFVISSLAGISPFFPISLNIFGLNPLGLPSARNAREEYSDEKPKPTKSTVKFFRLGFAPGRGTILVQRVAADAVLVGIRPL